MTRKAELIRSVKGTRDLLPGETALWQRVEDEARRTFAAYNFREIRTPVLEPTALFARSVGEDTDIVSKEMYSFEDRIPEELDGLRKSVMHFEPNVDKPETLESFVFLLDQLARAVRAGVEAQETPSSPENTKSLRYLEGIVSEGRKLLTERGKEPPDEYYWAKWMLLRRDLFECLMELQLAFPISLRPEATASVVRAYIEHGLFNEGRLHKLYYMGAMFRRERPQKGRYRQFYQIGAEVLGSDHPSIDAEFLEMLVLFLGRVGLKEYNLLLNSVGCPKCRAEYVGVLRRALEQVKERMCGDCQRRAETNPLRVLDCKVEADQPVIEKLPHILAHLCAECRQHFDCVTGELQQRGIPYQITPRLVRGLDYYTRTTFEMTSNVLGAQNAFLGGGRYDGLAEMLGGPPTPGFGVAIGEDRLLLAVQQAGGIKADDGLDIYVAWMGDATQQPAMQLVRELRREGLRVEIGYEPVKLKKSLGLANKLGARFAVIIGEGELQSGRYQVKDMATGQQEEVEPARVASYLKEKLAGAPH